MQVSFNCNIYKTPANNIKTIKTNNIYRPTFKADSFEKENKVSSNKSNFSIKNDLAIAEIVAETGILYEIKTGKIHGIKEMQEYAQEVKTKSEKLREEVSTIYNNGGKNNGETVATIVNNDGSDTMKEFDKDGKIVRESIFTNNILTDLEITTKNGKDVYGYREDGKPANFMKSYKESADGSESAEKLLGFFDDELSKYTEKYEKKADGNEKCAKSCKFENNKLTDFLMGIEVQADGSKKYEKVLLFDNEKLIAYISGLEEKSDGSSKMSKGIIFEKGKTTKITNKKF